MEQIIHKFELAGLGKAPFVCYSVVHGDWDNCQFCQHPIKERCYIRSSDNKTFYVGNECVNQTGDTGLVNETKLKINELRKKMRHEREAKLIEEGRLVLFAFPKLYSAYVAEPITSKLMKEPYLSKFVRTGFSWGGNKGKLNTVKKIWDFAKTVLTEQEIKEFYENKESWLAKLAEELRLEKEAEEAKRVNHLAEYRKKQDAIREKNAELIGILHTLSQSPFVRDMISKLTYSSLNSFSERQQEVLYDIFGKHFGKVGTPEYEAARERLKNENSSV